MRAMYRVHGAATRARLHQRLHKVCHMFRSHSVCLYCVSISMTIEKYVTMGKKLDNDEGDNKSEGEKEFEREQQIQDDLAKAEA